LFVCLALYSFQGASRCSLRARAPRQLVQFTTSFPICQPLFFNFFQVLFEVAMFLSVVPAVRLFPSGSLVSILLFSLLLNLPVFSFIRVLSFYPHSHPFI